MFNSLELGKLLYSSFGNSIFKWYTSKNSDPYAPFYIPHDLYSQTQLISYISRIRHLFNEFELLNLNLWLFDIETTISGIGKLASSITIHTIETVLFSMLSEAQQKNFLFPIITWINTNWLASEYHSDQCLPFLHCFFTRITMIVQANGCTTVNASEM